MSQPVIIVKKPACPRPEAKAPKSPMALIEQNIRIQEQKARAMLKNLEKVMVRCGYSRPWLYRSGRGSKQDPATLIRWTGEQISLLNRKKDWISVEDLNTKQLIDIAFHLPGLLDGLEKNSRHVLQHMTETLQQMEQFVDRIENDPQPNNEDSDAQTP